jgi:guanylate kinase
MGKLFIITGPSCVGKGPLVEALGKFYPDLMASLAPLVCYNDRRPRPGERDGVTYHFRPRAEIEKFVENSDYAVVDVRGDLQAANLHELEALLGEGDVLYEGNVWMAQRLLATPLRARADLRSLFLAPLSREEILYIKDSARRVSPARFVTNVMRRKLLHRAKCQLGVLALPDLENIEVRARSAWDELKLAPEFDFVRPNHDGEGNDNWDAFYYPVGDARSTLLTAAAFLRGEEPAGLEKWEPALFD